MIIFLAIVVIGIIVLLSNVDTGSESTTSNTTHTVRHEPSIHLDPKNPYDICCALACLATAVPYCKSGAYGYLIIRISSKESYTNIRISLNGFNYKDKGAYRSTWIDTSIADYLNTIPFATTDTNALEIRFNRCLDTDRVISAIRKGKGMAKCPSDRCKLDVIHPKVDPSCTDIHFVTDM